MDQEDKKKKTKLFVIIMGVTVTALIVIGTILSWNIIQDGRKNSDAMMQAELIDITLEIPVAKETSRIQ